MSDKPKPNGYHDRQYLTAAIRANKAMCRTLSTIADEAARFPQFSGPLLQVSNLLTAQLHNLTEMERIREVNR